MISNKKPTTNLLFFICLTKIFSFFITLVFYLFQQRRTSERENTLMRLCACTLYSIDSFR